MSNSMIAGFNPSLVTGSMGANGTASEIFDLASSSLLGLIADNMSSGTLNFEVASYHPFPTTPGVGTLLTNQPVGTLRLLRNLDATVVATGTLSGNIALTADAIRVLAPYRYVRIVASAAQANAPKFTFVVKA